MECERSLGWRPSMKFCFHAVFALGRTIASAENQAVYCRIPAQGIDKGQHGFPRSFIPRASGSNCRNILDGSFPLFRRLKGAIVGGWTSRAERGNDFMTRVILAWSAGALPDARAIIASAEKLLPRHKNFLHGTQNRSRAVCKNCTALESGFSFRAIIAWNAGAVFCSV